MTMWTSYSSSPYLSAGDFEPGEEKRLTIKAIRSELVGRERDNKPVALLRGAGREAAHPEQDEPAAARHSAALRSRTASARPSVLHVIETEYGGEAAGGIRIKLVTPPRADFAPNARERAGVRAGTVISGVAIRRRGEKG